MRAIVVWSIHDSVVIEQKDFKDWEDIKKELNGGYLEMLPVGEDFTVYIDEDGKGKILPYNPGATAIIKAMLCQAGRTLLPGDYIVGPAVFVGIKPGAEGPEECDLPVHVIRRYFVGPMSVRLPKE